MKNPVGNDYSSYIPFIEWCSRNITVQQTKILLSSTNPTNMWLAIPKSDLTDKIEAYQESCYNSQDVMWHLFNLTELRMAMLEEYNTSDDTAGLLITDRYLEKSELDLLERAIEVIEDDEFSKIIMLVKWISQLLYLHCIRPRQIHAMITQFEKLRKHENEEILRDLLNELLDIILDVYAEIYANVQHQECEALAALLQSEYKIIYHGIFQVCSQYLIKMLPIFNKNLFQIPFMCYQSGTCCGELQIFTTGKIHSDDSVILVVDEVDDDFELVANVKAFVVVFANNLYHRCLLQARKMGIPVAIGYFPPVNEGRYIINVNQDSYTIQKA